MPPAEVAAELNRERLPARIDVNQATEAELELLPGVGPVLARAIVEYRSERCPFRAVEDLDQVAGVGPATLERLRERVRFGGTTSE